MNYSHTNFFDYLFEHTKNLEKPFLLNPKELISYKDLYARCIKLAEYLNQTQGTGQNILILCPNSLFFITVYLATIKSRNVIVPLNYEIEQRNLDYILNLCESTLVFTTSQYKKKLDFKNTEIIDESVLEEILAHPDSRYVSRQEDQKTSRPEDQKTVSCPESSIQNPVSPSTIQHPVSDSSNPTPNIEHRIPNTEVQDADLYPNPNPTPTPTHPESSIQYPVSTSTIQHPVSSSIDSLAEIIFTSGSTGEPKGVMISHKNLMANTWSILEYLKLTQDDIMLVVLPFYYCYGLSLLHTHLRVGGSVVLNNMFIMLGGVINDLKKYKCTGFAGVPSHFQILLRKSDSFKTTCFPDLKYVTQAGGKLHDVFIKEFTEALPDIRFNVMYGQTEATARLTWLPPERLYDKIGSCGKAIPGIELKIVNSNGEKVKPGETGEIVASGDSITKGYYNDLESSILVVKDHWLYTGDLAYTDLDGYLYLTARKKEIIKVGGKRVSPKEIESVINSLPLVIDCTVEGVFDNLLGETIKATIIASDIEKLTNNEIKQFCLRELTTYKIPQIIQIKELYEMSATGKKVRN